MEVRIYQINSDRDVNGVIYEGLDGLKRWQGSADVDAGLYDKVYEGDIEGKSLDDVYTVLNTNHPFDYRARSLSMSDVVEVVSSPKIVGTIDFIETGMCAVYTDFIEYTLAIENLRENDVDFEAHDYVGLEEPAVEKGFYFCDRFGFKKIEFDAEKTIDVIAERAKDIELMKVVLVEPGKEARAAEIDGSLRGMQQVVGGLIEKFDLYEDEVSIICNEEAKLCGLPFNRGVFDEDGELVDIIAGTFFICGCRVEAENFESLTAEQASKYLEQFRYPERFYKTPVGIVAEKIKPSLNEKIKEAKPVVNTNPKVREPMNKRDIDSRANVRE